MLPVSSLLPELCIFLRKLPELLVEPGEACFQIDQALVSAVHMPVEVRVRRLFDRPAIGHTCGGRLLDVGGECLGCLGRIR